MNISPVYDSDWKKHDIEEKLEIIKYKLNEIIEELNSK